MRSVVIGTAGHIDHGKTALVEALTGIYTSRLREEVRRGMTIDLGFAYLEVKRPSRPPLLLSFVDVPGHSMFIRNMLAGAGGIDIVLLVISAEEGIKPQTTEHLAICELLGVQTGLVVLTKADAVDALRLASVRHEVREVLGQSFFHLTADEPLAVSARTGEGIPQLVSRLADAAEQIPLRDSEGLTRLPVDRAFTMHGFGTVVTGTLLSGSIQLEQRLSIEPGGAEVRVRNIQSHGCNVKRVLAGSRVALNVTGADCQSITRGSTLIEPDTLNAVDVIETEITLLPNAHDLKHGSILSFHAFTVECSAKILLYSRTVLDAGEQAFARLKLQRSIFLVPGDRFILRRPSPSATIGGGKIIEIDPVLKQARQLSLQWLHTIREIEPFPALVRRAARRALAGLDGAAAVREMGIARARVDKLLEQGVEQGELIRLNYQRFIHRPLYEASLQNVVLKLDGYHSRCPAQPGVNKAELQATAGLPLELFGCILNDLSARRAIGLHGDLVSRFGFQPQFSHVDHEVLGAIAEFYLNAGLETPRLQAVAEAVKRPLPDIQRAIAKLLQENVLTRVGNDGYVHGGALAALRSKLEGFKGKSVDVSQFKELTGLSRKHAIPWLEYLDRARITRRVGDSRLVI